MKKRIKKNYFSIKKKSIKIYEKGYIIDKIRVPDFKDKKAFKKVSLFIKDYVDKSLNTVDKLKSLGALKKFKIFSDFLKKEGVRDIKDYESYLTFLDKVRTTFKFDRKNIVSFLYNLGVNLIFIPAKENRDIDLKYVESVSLFIKSVPTVMIFLSFDSSLNKRIFNNILYSIYYLVFPDSGHIRANKFSYSMLMSEDIILGNLSSDMKGEFLLSLKNDKELAKQVFSRIYVKTGLSVINIIKTLLSVDYLDRYKNEGYYKDVIDSLEKEIMLGSLKAEPVVLGNMADFLNKKNNFLIKKGR